MCSSIADTMWTARFLGIERTWDSKETYFLRHSAVYIQKHKKRVYRKSCSYTYSRSSRTVVIYGFSMSALVTQKTNCDSAREPGISLNVWRDFDVLLVLAARREREAFFLFSPPFHLSSLILLFLSLYIYIYIYTLYTQSLSLETPTVFSLFVAQWRLFRMQWTDGVSYSVAFLRFFESHKSRKSLLYTPLSLLWMRYTGYCSTSFS